VDVTVDIDSAYVCFDDSCYPALVGRETPKGEFTLTQYSIEDPRYGGDLLVFKVGDEAVYAIHRVLDVPGQQRLARIHSPYSQHRVMVTNGCVNVTPEVYDKLIACCSKSKVTIK
jgi:hypothetical protein